MAGPHALCTAFEPSSIAVIGASDTPGSVGRILFRNLLDGGYRGTLYAVNPKYTVVWGVKCYPSLAALPATPDLAVVVTPAQTVPKLIDDAGRRGAAAAAAPMSTSSSPPISSSPSSDRPNVASRSITSRSRMSSFRSSSRQMVMA